MSRRPRQYGPRRPPKPLARFIFDPIPCFMCDETGVLTRAKYPFDRYYLDFPDETEHPCTLCHGTGTYTPIAVGSSDPFADLYTDLGGEA